MSTLDDRELMRALDPGGMSAHIERFPELLDEGHRITRGVRFAAAPDGLTAVVVLGMGGSAIGGELVAGYAADSLRVPLRVVRDYVCPAFVGPSTLVIASSYSGDTEETLAAHAEVSDRGAHVVCVTTGGRLRETAHRLGQDVVVIPGGLPPRSALGYNLAALVVVLERAGLLPDQTEALTEAVATARDAVERFGLGRATPGNEAKELAAWLRDRIPVIYGTPPWTSAVATRWCGQLSENSKLIGHRNELPEMNHNEIVGWSAARPLAGAARAVFLRDVEDHPRTARRIELTAQAIAAAGADVRSVMGFGTSRLARLVSLVLLGDFVSFYLAVLGGADPTPVEPIDRLKAALAGDRGEHDA